jgi:HD superfamily phosphohydrolase
MGLSRGFPKTINDAVWGTIDVLPPEIAILDSPMLQRLRGVKQLGMAYLVYPGAVHDRLEHTLGVLEAAQRMMDALARNGDRRQRFGIPEDDSIPPPSKLDIMSTRIGALFHDVGHGPCSHVLESALRGRLSQEFDNVEDVLRNSFAGVARIATSEAIAALIVLSEPMRPILEDARFATDDPVPYLPTAVTSRILGSRACLTATYLSGVLSGPLDADKLDYMARDSHHAGLPLGIDVIRLISKLQVVTVTPQNAPNEALQKRARGMPNERFYELGISVAGLGAYEQMVIGRVILYDRLYYHHKVRAAEAMVRRIVTLADQERGRQLTLSEMMYNISDRGMLGVLSGELKSDSVPSGDVRTRALGHLLLDRRVYHRAFAFAARFIDGLDGLPQKDQLDTRALLWNGILDELLEPDGCNALATEIFTTAKRIGEVIPDFKGVSESLLGEHIIVDLPLNRVVVRGSDILTRTEAGHVGTPNLFFDPEKWSQAYEQQKQCGFVFTSKEYVPLVALAAKVVFFERFQTSMGSNTDQACKLVAPIAPEILATLARNQICSAECVTAIAEASPNFILFDEGQMRVPDSWKIEDPDLARRLADGLNEVLVGGLPASMHRATIDAIGHMIMFIDVTAKSGSFVGLKTLAEKELQRFLKDHLRSREVDVQEGTEIGGGESDLVLPGPLIVENKVRENTADPFEVGQHYVWQARRYSIPISSRVSFVVLAYRPADEYTILPMSRRIAVAIPDSGPKGHVQIRVVVPWGEGVPSSAKAPK